LWLRSSQNCFEKITNLVLLLPTVVLLKTLYF
jgi:hypothetical protein